MKRKSLIAFHILIWFILLLKDFLLKFLNTRRKISDSFFSSLLIDSSYLLIAVIVFYSSYFLVARFLIGPSKRIMVGVSNVLTVLLIAVFTRYAVEFWFVKPVMGFDNYGNNTHFTWSYFVLNAVSYYWSYVLYGLLYGFAEYYFFQQQRERQLLQSEISFLRSQINPHFLFNSINDIYSLALNRPLQAPNALLKLSDLLRYTLYSSKMQLVPLAEEAGYLQSYIELENIGKDGKSYIKTIFTLEKNNYKIAPMLLIPFVENAIKHGMAQSPTHPITVLLKAEKRNIEFRCHNYKSEGNKDPHGGIGLTNIRRRLQLEYHSRHKLNIKDTSSEFEINLSLIL